MSKYVNPPRSESIVHIRYSMVEHFESSNAISLSINGKRLNRTLRILPIQKNNNTRPIITPLPARTEHRLALFAVYDGQ